MPETRAAKADASRNLSQVRKRVRFCMCAIVYWIGSNSVFIRLHVSSHSFSLRDATPFSEPSSNLHKWFSINLLRSERVCGSISWVKLNIEQEN